MMLDTVAKMFEKLSRVVGRAVAWCVLLMTLVMFAVVVLRYFFGAGSIALQESVLYFHSLVFMLGLAWTLADDQHVRVDIFYSSWSARARAWVDLGGALVFLLPICVVILVTSIPYVMDSWAVMETSREAGGLPFVYALKTLIPVAAILLGLQAIAMALHSVQVLRGRA